MDQFQLVTDLTPKGDQPAARLWRAALPSADHAYGVVPGLGRRQCFYG